MDSLFLRMHIKWLEPCQLAGQLVSLSLSFMFVSRSPQPEVCPEHFDPHANNLDKKIIGPLYTQQDSRRSNYQHPLAFVHRRHTAGRTDFEVRILDGHVSGHSPKDSRISKPSVSGRSKSL